MPKYGVNLYTTASVHIEVEADDAEAAIEAAFDQAPSAAWDWPDMGDWVTGSEMFPDQYKPDEDAELID